MVVQQNARHVLRLKQYGVPSPAVQDYVRAQVACCVLQTRGRKKSMEDRHVLAALDPSQGVEQALGPIGLQDKVSVAAVFDGHAGYATAAYAAQHIPNLLHEALSGRPGSRTQGGLAFRRQTQH